MFEVISPLYPVEHDNIFNNSVKMCIIFSTAFMKQIITNWKMDYFPVGILERNNSKTPTQRDEELLLHIFPCTNDSEYWVNIYNDSSFFFSFIRKKVSPHKNINKYSQYFFLRAIEYTKLTKNSAPKYPRDKFIDRWP